MILVLVGGLDGCDQLFSVEHWAAWVDQASRSDRRACVTRYQLDVKVIDGPVAHGDLVDPLDVSQREAKCTCHIATGGEESGGCGIVELGEVMDVWLPHHDGVSRDSWIGCQDDSDIFVISDQMLRAEHVGVGQLSALIADTVFVQGDHSFADLSSSVLPSR